MTATSTPLERPAGTADGDLRRRVLAGLPVTDRRVTVAGIPTAILEGGEGPPVILLHGPGEFAATWLRVIPELVATHAVVAPDLPGHGASGMGDGDLGAQRVLRWLSELAERTCSSPPALVGHGLGGALAARFAALRPDRARALVLVDSFGLAPLRPSPRFALALVPFLVRPTEGTQRRLMQRCMADLDGLRATMGERLDTLEAYALDRARHGEMSAAVRRLMRELGTPAIPAGELSRISAPTTLIWGREDLQVRLAVAEAASARHGWPLHVIDGAADDPAVERPEEFMRALGTALAIQKEIS